MLDNKNFINGYENTKLIRYDELTNDQFIPYASLNENDKIQGVLKANILDENGNLKQFYSKTESHVCVIAATRLGKTTSYVIPTILSFSKMKRSMFISDPKGELYEHTASELKNQGYKVLLINFTNYEHSEFFNPLTPIYRKYQSMYALYDEVELVKTKKGNRNKFRGKIYESQAELDHIIAQLQKKIKNDVAYDIETMASYIIKEKVTNDPYWEISSRNLLQAFLWSMLEDSREETCLDSTCKLITEGTYSFKTMFEIFKSHISEETSSDIDEYACNSIEYYFLGRNQSSKAKLIANNIVDNANNTKRCIYSCFDGYTSYLNQSSATLITSCNSFDLKEELDKPLAIYVKYSSDEDSNFDLICLFTQVTYSILKEKADKQRDSKLKTPFYFVLDEFGNFPAIKGFKTKISACASSNIYFIIVIQSYAQVETIYKEEAQIIFDNLNIHVFFGSNNNDTLVKFSKECGKFSRLSPLSAFNGNTAYIDKYAIETLNRVTVSDLSSLKIGECVVTEANSGYVLWSKLERYYLCDELNSLPISYDKDYVSSISPFDDEYQYTEDKLLWKNLKVKISS